MSKCMDKIAGAHEVIGDELNGEAENSGIDGPSISRALDQHMQSGMRQFNRQLRLMGVIQSGF
jgi:hypothetical protein